MSMVGCSESYYRVLGVDEGSSQDTIRRAYRKLAMLVWECLSGYGLFNLFPGLENSASLDLNWRAKRIFMKWHPDKWTKSPSLLGEAKKKFQKVQEAYSVLSDKRKRTLYDSGLYDLAEDDEEDLSDFLQEMVSHMARVRKERKEYSLEELQGMLAEMANGFEFPNFSGVPGENWSTFDFPSWNCDFSTFTHGESTKRARCDNNVAELRNPQLQTSGFSLHRSSQFCS